MSGTDRPITNQITQQVYSSMPNAGLRRFGQPFSPVVHHRFNQRCQDFLHRVIDNPTVYILTSPVCHGT